MIVAATDFNVPPYAIPNLQGVINSFNAYVSAAEQEVLIDLMGYTLYIDFINGIAVTPTPAAHWLALRDGGTYLNSENESSYYSGMKAFLIPYIYSMWLRDNFDNDSAFGVSLALVENAEIISPSTRIVRAYNKYSELIGFSEYKLNYFNSDNSFFGFLESDRLNYPSWEYTCKRDPGTMNLWNI